MAMVGLTALAMVCYVAARESVCIVLLRNFAWLMLQ